MVVVNIVLYYLLVCVNPWSHFSYGELLVQCSWVSYAKYVGGFYLLSPATNPPIPCWLCKS